MALSFINTCYYPNCGMNFSTQHQLIIHIENTHVDFDPKTIEEVEKSRFQHAMVPPSYVLKYNLNNEFSPSDISIKQEVLEDDCRFPSDYSFPSSYESMFGYNPDNVVVKVEPLDLNQLKLEHRGSVINDAYSKKKSSISQGGKRRKIPPLCDNARKFACPVPGCNKKYKNINGARYHTKHCHDSFGNTIKPRKDYHCACGKQYKTAAGLRSHLQVYSDKNHGVIVTSANVNPIDGNNNNEATKHIIMPRPMCTSDACSHSFDTCHMPSSNDVIAGGRGLWQMKGDYGSVVYDDRTRSFRGVAITDGCQIKCEPTDCQYEHKYY